MARLHRLKIDPEFFNAVQSGEKPYEIRKDDRKPRYRVGDMVWFRVFNRKSGRYGRRFICKTISHILRGRAAIEFGLRKGYCALGLRAPTFEDINALQKEAT